MACADSITDMTLLAHCLICTHTYMHHTIDLVNLGGHSVAVAQLDVGDMPLGDAPLAVDADTEDDDNSPSSDMLDGMHNCNDL
jgi:hypothetical protein